jgi:hypothetical protein
MAMGLLCGDMTANEGLIWAPYCPAKKTPILPHYVSLHMLMCRCVDLGPAA